MSPVADKDLAAFMEEAASHVQAASLPNTESSTARLREQALANEMRATLRTFFGCLAASLAYLHDNSVRHKDIKPQNILVRSGNVLLTDFGLSRDFADDIGSTTSGITPSTPRYSPPEVAAYEARNTSADIWSLGCVFFEMVAALHGYNIEWLKRYIASKHTSSTHYYANDKAYAELIIEWEMAWKPTDRRPLHWIPNMLQRDRLARPTAAAILGNITSTGEEVPVLTSFCGICCVPHEQSDSEDSLVDETMVLSIEERQIPRSTMTSPYHAIDKDDPLRTDALRVIGERQLPRIPRVPDPDHAIDEPSPARRAMEHVPIVSTELLHPSVDRNNDAQIGPPEALQQDRTRSDNTAIEGGIYETGYFVPNTGTSGPRTLRPQRQPSVEPIVRGFLSFRRRTNVFRPFELALLKRKYFWFGESSYQHLLYFARNPPPNTPEGILNLTYASRLTKFQSKYICLNVAAHKGERSDEYIFKAQSLLDRDGWFVTFEWAIREARAHRSKEELEAIGPH
ncbi:kinase-like protein [Trematosphaeria pertusa]|uniref:non-specific serine/threonine protein kinase n=1 Tax=Trematosphaeria pertusa TaxID=390896 RepID=A0A6A6J7F5_9PLEO|nr:kinase-like protein [Trematosphaeria pertusa]KAF2257373.1 kinase-like protein [Trematosphaeria pertusa]